MLFILLFWVIRSFLLQIIDLAKALKGEKGKITVDTVKEHSKKEPDYKCVDSMHIFHTILLRELPPERIGGIINLILATRPSATTEEVEDSLVCNLQFFMSLIHSKLTFFSICRIFQRYLYGSGSYVKIPNIPPMRKF